MRGKLLGRLLQGGKGCDVIPIERSEAETIAGVQGHISCVVQARKVDTEARSQIS